MLLLPVEATPFLLSFDEGHRELEGDTGGNSGGCAIGSDSRVITSGNDAEAGGAMPSPIHGAEEIDEDGGGGGGGGESGMSMKRENSPKKCLRASELSGPSHAGWMAHAATRLSGVSPGI